MMKKKGATAIVIIVCIFLFSQTSWALERKSILLSPIKEEKIEMKINFYTIDRKKATKGESVGTAELKEQKLEVNVTDPKLEKILKEPYTTMTGEVKEGIARDWLITYQPGTKEHLPAIAIECYRFGYIGEIEEEVF